MARTKGPQRSAIEAARAVDHEHHRLEWAARHPGRADEERGFRKARAEALKRWGHKREGTAETHEAHAQRRAGAIARLHATGYLNDDELAWSQEIAAAVAGIMADALVRTASMETRVDSSRHGDAFYEALGAVWREMAYSRWRTWLGPRAAVVLDIIVHDVGLTRAAAQHGMGARRVRKLLCEALALWSCLYRAVRNEVREADLIAAHAGLV